MPEQAKHTPGPWELDFNNTHVGTIATVYHCPQGWADVWSRNWGCETEDGYAQQQLANARLIAAAPDLLDKLKQLVARYKFDGIPNDSLRFVQEAEAAIAKAEGRAA